MSAPLPEQLDPWRAVQCGSTFAGEAELDALPRLRAAVNGAAGGAWYVLSFHRDEQGQAVVTGRVSMRLRLICQRCLGEVEVEVDAAIGLVLVRAVGERDRLGLGEMPGLPDDLDSMPLGDEPVRALDWVEDEILLALPLVPLHPSDACGARTDAQGDEPAPVRRANPFAVLAALREKPSGSGADES